MLWGLEGELGRIRLATLLIIIEIHSRSLNTYLYCRHFSTICLTYCLLSSLCSTNLSLLTQKICVVSFFFFF